ncbi:hypothetical protein [Deinococcus sp. JMULE3]|uniref:hypothetical protein n=1 Tax=Deinococcus sp. JMULE3 TaxID=2518341 RepID=UPI0015769F2B|nr:hypothetical protein [Deinococcus sp. JMULE3]
MSNEIIEDFAHSYRREYDFYFAASKYLADYVEEGLKGIGVRAIITFRAKSPSSLRDKLIRRNEKIPYENRDQIYEDICDFAGVRIALYFPSDKSIVEEYIKQELDLQEVKKFPQENNSSVFPGYVAEHYRVRIKSDKVPQEFSRFCDTRMEIQVASVLMHGWSEVEHDIIYKPSSGEPDKEEKRVLEIINGIVVSSEMALDHLKFLIDKRANDRRRKFRNVYEFAGFVHDFVKSRDGSNSSLASIRNPDFLFEALSSSGINTPDELKKILNATRFSSKNYLINVLIIETWLSLDPGRSDNLISIINKRYGGYSRLSEDEKKDINQFVRLYSHMISFINKYSIDNLSGKKRKSYKIISKRRLEELGFDASNVKDITEHSRVVFANVINGRFNSVYGEIETSMIEIYNLLVEKSDYIQSYEDIRTISEILSEYQLHL